MTPRAPALLLTSLLALAACDEPPAKPTAASATASTPAPAPTPPPVAAKPTTMPELLVDPEGPFLGGKRIRLGDPGGAEQLAKVVADLPINGGPVTLIADKKAKTPDVAMVVAALGAAGAPKVILRTDGRNDVPKELSVTPLSRLSSPPGCSVVTMVLKDLSTAVWSLSGGIAKAQKKGFAGPDLSHTGETLTKSLAACDSTMAFFSADDSVGWEMAYNLGGTIVTSDAKKRIDTLVLLPVAPVAGRPVPVAK